MSPAGPFLARIAADRRRRVAEMKLAVPPHLLRARLGTRREGGRLERALRRGGAAAPLKLVCEVKRASPSRGMLNEHLDPVALAKVFAAGGAAAISLVTEPDHFQGELRWMDQVRPEVALPLLLKDFVFDSYQLLDAAVRGADGVLLLAALLSETELQRLIGEAKVLGVDPLVEVHTLEELNAALRAGATLVGINHRNLHTFELDMSLSSRLLPLVPAMVTAVAESGVSKAEEIARLRDTRCDAVLMGEVFATAGDPAATLATLAAAARGERPSRSASDDLAR
jgi:indole-3-glycerol phosphate synthase